MIDGFRMRAVARWWRAARNFMKRSRKRLLSRLAFRWLLLSVRVDRLCRAWRYAWGGITTDDAQHLLAECEDYAGWYALLTLSAEDTLKSAREIYEDRPELPDLIWRGCELVRYKWISHDGELYEARRWAVELAAEYAAQNGTPLSRRDGGKDTDD